MSNSLLTVDKIAAEALAVAHEKAKFVKTTNLSYDDQFKETAGWKPGASLRIANPNQYTRRQGSRVMDVQDQAESSQTLTVATQDGVDMRFNSAELATDITKFSERFIEPAVSSLVSGIDGDYLAAMTKSVYNLTGTAGTVVGASGDISAIFNARAKLNQGLAPIENRAFQLDSVTMATIVNGKTGLFHPEGQVKKAFVDGYYGRAAGTDWYENERCWAMSNGTDVTATTDSTGLGTAASDGGYTEVDMHTALAVAQQRVGMSFTIAGVYALHPETKAPFGHLQQFVITAVGATQTTVAPKIYLSGARKNVGSVTGADLATTVFDSATLTFHGNASAVLKQSLMYHKDAFAFVTADLPIMADAASCVRVNKDGLSLRVWKGSDIRNDELLMRIDILYGWKSLRPEWACRVSN